MLPLLPRARFYIQSQRKGSLEMAEAGRFCIDWEDFKSTAADRFRGLIGKKDFSDVTLVAADGQRIPGHQVILASGSTFFKTLLEAEETPKPLIFLRGFESNILEPLMTFLYTGRAEVREELLAEFMALTQVNVIIMSLFSFIFLFLYMSLTQDLGVEGLASPNKSTEEDDKGKLAGIVDDYPQEERKVFDNETKPTSKEAAADMRIAKSDILNFYCNKCNRHFNIESNFNRHKLSAHGKEDGRGPSNRKSTFLVAIPDIDQDGFYSCNKCEKRISDRSNYRRHFLRDHLNIQRKCDKCEYSSTDPVKLWRHRKNDHPKTSIVIDKKPVLGQE